MRICYVEKRFGAEALLTIQRTNEIITDYKAQGFDLTLRQVYYQHVARGYIPNTERSYKNLGNVINDARLAGLIDWDAIIDRTRHMRSNSHWTSPAGIVEACADQYQIDKWRGQQYRPEVWVEKDALIGIVQDVCRRLDIPHFSCRGYVSQSEMHDSAMRLKRVVHSGATPVIIHLGDHDPSGKDMTRDIEDRMRLFMGGLDLERIALNMDQIERFSPPPNPAKITDSRAKAYIAEFGDESWELDAMEPSYLVEIIEKKVLEFRDEGKWRACIEEEKIAKGLLKDTAAELDEKQNELLENRKQEETEE